MKRRAFLTAIGLAPLLPVASKATEMLPKQREVHLASGSVTARNITDKIKIDRINFNKIIIDRVKSAQTRGLLR